MENEFYINALQQEIAILAEIDHPNLLKILNVYEDS